jgi:hypothetical protein
MPEFEMGPKEMKKCYEKTSERYLAYLYLENADKSKYSTLLSGLNTQQSVGNVQYPKTVVEANNVLSNHLLDTPLKKKRKGTELKQKPKKTNASKKAEQDVEISFVQIEGKCYCCGKAGHRSNNCKFKDRLKEQWAIHKGQQSFVQNQIP